MTITEATQSRIIAVKQVSGQHLGGRRVVAIVDDSGDVSRIINKPVYASGTFW